MVDIQSLYVKLNGTIQIYDRFDVFTQHQFHVAILVYFFGEKIQF